MSTIHSKYPFDDRRGAMRFPIVGDLHFVVRGEGGGTLRGTGHVQDISSTGSPFAPASHFSPAGRFKYQWPGPPD